MVGLVPSAQGGKVNGLQHPKRGSGRRLRAPARRPTSLVAAGLSLYAVALVFPILLHQVTAWISAVAVVGTLLLLAGLHVRWSSESAAV